MINEIVGVVISKEIKITIRVNEQIRVPEVRLIDSAGNMLGVFSTHAALDMARDNDLDLVEISPNAEPPVCKIVNYGKYKYELQKKANEVKKKQKVIETKEIKMRPNIAEMDYSVKLKSVKSFLSDGCKVKISVVFRGREFQYQEVGFNLIKKMQADVEELARVESMPKMEGKTILMVIAPK